MTAGHPPVGRRVFRSGLAGLGGAASAVVAALLIVDAALRAGAADAMLIAPWILLVLWAVYVLVYAPHVSTDATGIRLRNVLRIADAPWAHVTDIRMRWAVEVELDDGRMLRAWGGPVAARPARPNRLGRDAAPAEPSSLRDLAMIRDEWQAHRDDPPTGPVTGRWDTASLAVLGSLLLWALAAVLISGGAR